MKVPVALFVPGPVQKDEKDWIGARQQLDKELAKFLWLSPIARHIVGGKFDPAKLSFPFNLIPALRKMPASDVRDWPAIRSLAGELATTMQGVEQRPTAR
jgi:menaquinone-dependent protoporphyrinogen oxidase